MRTGHLCLLARHAGIFVAIARGQCACCHLGYGIDDVARTVAVGRHALHVDGREEVEPGERLGTVGLAELDKLADRSHASRGFYIYVVERLHAVAAVGRSLDDDAVELGETVEVRGIYASEVSRQRVDDILRGYAGTLTLSLVYVDPVLREFGTERRVCHLYLRPLVKLCQEIVGYLTQGINALAAAVLYVKLKTVTCTVARYHRRREHEYGCVLDVCSAAVDFVAYGINTAFVALAFVPVLQLDDEHTVRRAAARTHAEAGYFVEVLYLRYVFQLFLHLSHNLGCFGEGASCRRIETHED